ncbi:MAG: hypothetical protein AB8C02_05620 [Halioglobus sp.]
MPLTLANREYDELIGLIYQGALEPQPWQSALPALRTAFDAQVVSLILRPPSEHDEGVILNCVRPDATSIASSADNPSAALSDDPIADPSDWQASAYREQFFSLDPFINLPLDTVITLSDVLPDKALVKTDYYLHYLEPIGLFRILGVDTAEPGGMLARLRVSRRSDENSFKKRERELLQALTPHLSRAIEIYAKLNRMASERDVYAGAVNQLSMASIILDEKGRILSTNATGQALLNTSSDLGVRDDHIFIEGRDINKELQLSLDTIIRAQQKGETSIVKALRVPRAGGRSDLGLVIKPAPASQWSEGQSSPSAVVFISDPDLPESTSGQILSELFALTPAESILAMALAKGLSLAEASQAQDISQHTARAQLKSIFAKTSVSRQAELVRLVLKSVASLA